MVIVKVMNHVRTSVEHVLMVVKTGMSEHVVLMVRNIDSLWIYMQYIGNLVALIVTDTISLATVYAQLACAVTYVTSLCLYVLEETRRIILYYRLPY